jgi:hypothetical protein
VRFSRVDAEDLASLNAQRAPSYRLNADPLRFMVAPSHFGALGSGVLEPSLAASVTQGAEDGGELGAYHHRHHLTRLRAFSDKVQEFLPVGQVAVVRYDATLNCPPASEELPP